MDLFINGDMCSHKDHSDARWGDTLIYKEPWIKANPGFKIEGISEFRFREYVNGRIHGNDSEDFTPYDMYGIGEGSVKMEVIGNYLQLTRLSVPVLESYSIPITHSKVEWFNLGHQLWCIYIK